MGECFLAGRSGGGTGKAFAVIHVDYPNGSTCTCTCTAGDANGKVLRAKDTSGAWNFQIPKAGTWEVKCWHGVQGSTDDPYETDSAEVVINTQSQMFSVSLAYRVIPDFTYKIGDVDAEYGTHYEVVKNDDTTSGQDVRIAYDKLGEYKNTNGWKIRFLESGTFTLTNNYGFSGSADVFLVGGGGAGATRAAGGGGYTKTVTNQTVNVSTSYSVAIGSGGTAGTTGNSLNGGLSSIFGIECSGGYGAASGGTSGDGGSGGGGGSDGGRVGGAGGYDGGDGGSSYRIPGKGQKTKKGPKGETGTTYEFGDSNLKLYAGGGGGGGSGDGAGGAGGAGGGGNGGSPDSTAGSNGTANTGGGGGGSHTGTGGNGGSGIVIIRNHR